MKAGKSAIWPWLSCPYNEHTLMDLPSSVISTRFGTVTPFSMFSINQPLFLQKTKPLYPNPKTYLGVEVEFGPERIRNLVIVCPQSVPIPKFKYTTIQAFIVHSTYRINFHCFVLCSIYNSVTSVVKLEGAELI